MKKYLLLIPLIVLFLTCSEDNNYYTGYMDVRLEMRGDSRLIEYRTERHQEWTKEL